MDNNVKARALGKFFFFLKSRPLVWDTITTTILSSFGKGAGFLIPFFVAAWFGVTAETDAFFYAYGLIVLMAVIFSPVVESITVPFIAEVRANGEDVGAFVGKVLCATLAILSVLSAAFLFFIKPALPLISRFSPEGVELIFVILLESVPLAVLLVWTSILSGTLNAYKMFGVPAVSPAFRAIVTLAFIFSFKDSMGVHAIALGYVVGEAVRLAILFAILGKIKSSIRLKLSLGWDKKFTDFIKASSYVVAGMSVLAFTSIINKTMASWTGSGGVSLLEYAERLYMIPVTLLSSGFIVTLLSHWSSNYSVKGDEGLKKDVAKAAGIIGLAGLLLTIAVYLLKDYIVSFAYGHGEFPKDKLTGVARMLWFFSLGLIPYFLLQVYTRAFLAMKETKVLLHTALMTISATLVLNYILIWEMGVAGLALSSSIVLFLALIFLNFVFQRRMNGIS